MTGVVDLDQLGLPALPQALPRPTVDAHTHLDSVEERTGLSADQSLEIADAVGIHWVIEAGDTAADSAWGEALARSHPQVVACVALHPNEVARHPQRFEEDFAAIARLAKAGDHVRAIGETGLDYYRTTDPVSQASQRAAFARHIQLACSVGKTLMIHDRDAHDDVLAVLDDSSKPPRVVMHSFSGDSDLAQACVERGHWLSFPGVITYKANHHLRRALAVTPDDKILVETDAPFLTPVPARGRPNGPYLVAHTIRFIAEQRGWELGEACDRLRENAFAAYGGHWGDAVGETANQVSPKRADSEQSGSDR
ncbi:MAG: TatD family hydrolase, partial [Propionibacteriaceae bacterium]|nr:TatD family hydrolase [Propionibacteriaceae bacterium]